MDSFYLQLRTMSGCTEAEAWELTSSCVAKVFEEQCIQHAPAANAAGLTSYSSKVSTILWAMLNAHKVMKEFLDSRFQNHPAIAPVLNLHVFKSRITIAAHSKLQTEVKALPTKLIFLDKLNDRISMLEKDKSGK
jgi:hypothetical protein